MSKITKFSAYTFFCLAQLCYLWNTPLLVAGQQISERSIARLTGARNNVEDEYIKVIKDNTSDSGWTVDVMQKFPSYLTDGWYQIYMYAEEQHKPTFRQYIYGTVFCSPISNQTRYDEKEFLDGFFIAQIMKMVLPGRGREDTCEVKEGKYAIQSEASVNADRRDPKNKYVALPYTFPFVVMANFITVDNRFNPITDYIFQLNFTVESLDNGSGKEENGNDDGESRYKCLNTEWNYYIIWGICTTYESSVNWIKHPLKSTKNLIQNLVGTNKSNKDKTSKNNTATDAPINVPARVIGVKNGIDNPYFSAVKDDSSATGWAIKANQNVTRKEYDNVLLFSVYEVDSTNDTFHKVFENIYLCDALLHDSRHDAFPIENYLPRQIADIIFPGHQGSCEFEAESTKSISPIGTVDINPRDNPRVIIPDKTFYNLMATVRSQDERDEPINSVYFFQVNFTIGDPDSTTKGGKSEYMCFNTRWNYYIFWRVCTIFEFIQSGISGILKKIF